MDIDAYIGVHAATAAAALQDRSCVVRKDLGGGNTVARTVGFNVQDLEGRGAFNGAGRAIDAVYICLVTDPAARTIAEGVVLGEGRLLIEDATAGRTFEVVSYTLTDRGHTARLECKRLG